MSIIQEISLSRHDLTKVERKIAAYIIDYPELVLKQNVAELAAAAGTSAATVIRFFHKSGYQNLAKFKILLAADLAVADRQVNDDVDPNSDYDIVKKKLLDNAVACLRQTSQTLTKLSVMALIQAIHDAKQIYLFGLGASSLVADNITQKWARLGIQVTAFQEMNLFLPVLETATQQDLIWFISNSGSTPEIIWAAQVAKEKKLTTISLTKYDANPLADLTSIRLHTATPLEAKVRSAATNSLLSQFLVVDIIYYFYLSQYYDESNTNITRTHQIIERYHQDFGLGINNTVRE